MTTVADAEQERERAKQAVERFVWRFDQSYRLLVYHAALPLVLTPELVNYLRNEFLRGEKVPWVAEVDLLLSDLCSQVGYELYAMDTQVRAYLLDEIKDQPFWQRRMQEVAQVLISYVSYLSRINPGQRQQELEAQRWAAMVYLGDESCKAAAREIAERLQDTGKLAQANGSIRAELARLTRITEELSPQLKEEPSLLEYAKLVQRVLRAPDTVNLTELQRSYSVEGVELTVPEKVLPEDLQQTVAFSGQIPDRLEGFPPLQTFKFEVVNLTTLKIDLQLFEFSVATIESKQTGWLRRKTELIIKRRQQLAWGFREDLGDGVQLEMVAIPEGSFVMGSPDTEEGHRDSESPQHQVTVKSFFMGKYSVTQAQWQAVAALPQVNSELDPEPSYFKGADRPVEQISWYDAVEFCSRLAQKTGRNYRLPSEAQWEYACRAGTTTPFHFGETITPKLANYDGNETYRNGVKGKSRRGTTAVGSFGVANDFGLYDMHGNVWEWCADNWHDNYRLLRGGSWGFIPVLCRSAYRFIDYPGVRFNYSFGFRVVCAAAWTQ
ncbi:MAG: formylglycine-generating enzyme family protein [Symploca sp. SIO2C1]|nr:formylglycine-generating enzyme family protein [Symploca sp. SIO2C1]